MKKLSCVISAPVDTYSGYGKRSADFVKALIKAKPDWDVLVLPQRWGNTRFGYLKDHGDVEITPRVIQNLTYQPDIWVQITVPNEFKKVGKYNIGVTAGIETTLCHQSWIEGCNNMDLVLVSSNHAKKVFEDTNYEFQDNATGQIVKRLKLNTKVEVLFEGIDLGIFFPIEKPLKEKSEIEQVLDSIPEYQCFLTVGHWLPGEVGEDRKNIGYTVKTFLETFKNNVSPPALILKVQAGSGTSIIDRDNLFDRIENIRKSVKGTLPNIYLLHGDLSETDMNLLYNHPKVFAMVSLTKGEGYGRPLLEFSLCNKPVIASAWSGHLDFLDSSFVKLVGGTLTPVHPSAQVQDMILGIAKWFSPDPVEIGRAYKDLIKNSSDWKTKAKRQGYKSRTEFSFDKMSEKLGQLLDQNMPQIPTQVELKLPPLKKLTPIS